MGKSMLPRERTPRTDFLNIRPSSRRFQRNMTIGQTHHARWRNSICSVWSASVCVCVPMFVIVP